MNFVVGDAITRGDVIDCDELARMWSRTTAMPRQTILMRLAGLTRAGAFDENAFVLEWGGRLAPDAAARSLGRLAAASDLEALALEGSTSPSNFDWPFLRLDALRRFCVSQSIRPPSGLFMLEMPNAVHAAPLPAPGGVSPSLEDAVAWFERMVDRLVTRRSVPEARVMLAKQEAWQLLRAMPEDANTASKIYMRFKAAKRRWREWRQSRGGLPRRRPGRPNMLKPPILAEFRRRLAAGERRVAKTSLR